jgi:putative pyruvate formate lyase activating enzyme
MKHPEKLYSSCTLCPRKCSVNRNDGERGFCGETALLRIACVCLHYGEEPPLTGKGGSGTVFFTGCTLKCRFCQNYQISREGIGEPVSEDELCRLFLVLQDKGAVNINLVTGTQFIPGIINVLHQAKGKGLHVPVVWNTSGFEEPCILKLLDPVVDIYVPDMKTLSKEIARRHFHAEQYPAKAAKALRLMAERKPLIIENGILKCGVIMRHLVIPGMLDETKKVLEWYKKHLENRALLSLMFQYTPLHCNHTEKIEIPDRHVSQKEYEEVMGFLDDAGIEYGFIQDRAENGIWLPDFNRKNPFPRDYAFPVWHFSDGKTVRKCL